MTLTDFPASAVCADAAPARRSAEPRAQDPDENPSCYSVTIFTNRWREIRDFYVEILDAKIISERPERYCEMTLGGIPLCLRRSEQGEVVSYFHLYLSLKNRAHILSELRQRGIIVTNVGPYTNFRDPEGRVIKLSDSKAMVA